MDTDDTPRPDDRGDVIFTAYITLRNGRRLYAASVGLKAFCIPVKKRLT